MIKENLQDWKNIVEKDVKKVGGKYNLDKLNLKFAGKKYRIILSLLLLFGFVSLMIGAVVRFHMVVANNSSPIAATMLFILGAILLIVAIILGIFQYKIIKVEKKIIAELNINNYYAAAIAQLTENKYQLVSLKKAFDLAPRNFLPTSGKSRTDNVINVIAQDIKFSFGTITNEITRTTTDSKGHSRTERTYKRYRYLNIMLVTESNLVATIKKSESFLKIFKSKDNTDLESTEFEKMFAVVANDQILIRKLLVPKVLANLVDKANSESNIPAIEFNHQNLTMFSESFRVSSWSDPKGVIGGVDLFDDYQNLTNNLCQKITDDIKLFLTNLSWIETYDVI